jgi:hypothetical protein
MVRRAPGRDRDPPGGVAPLGGGDERFEGWGWEDTAMYLALETVYGVSTFDPDGTIRCLWHPPAMRDSYNRSTNKDLFTNEYVPATGRPKAMLEVTHRWQTEPPPAGA